MPPPTRSLRSRRAYDFICLAIAEEKLNVKIVCALPGLTTGYGPSHQATDDLAIFRAMPNLTIVDPCDALDIEQAVPAIAAHEGPVYMRLLRGNVPLVLDQYDYRFELGKAKLLRDGKDALIISSGFMTMRAGSGECVGIEGVDVAILHSPTIKPLDEEVILKEASRNGRAVIVAENHSIIGGLGEAVAGLLLRSGWLRRSGRSPCRMRFSTPAPCRRCTTATASRRGHGEEHQRVGVVSVAHRLHRLPCCSHTPTVVR